jgi:hypothetical protein
MGWRVCLAAEPTTAPQNITSMLLLDTMTSPLCATTQPPSWKAANQPDACFLIGTQITFGAPVIQAVGSRPLVVFASDTITIATQLDVASRATRSGAGAPSTLCNPPTAATGGQTGGGGAGGTFGTQGGDGGAGSSGGASGTPGRASMRDSQLPTVLRAGCTGGVGGSTANAGGMPGAGGGAVYLVAKNRITINGFINASGAPGLGGNPVAGGGGGGSGGMIVLYAPTITGNGGVLVANGGGAGGGGGTSNVGGTGSEPSPQMPAMIASGGTGGAGGGVGGNGFAGTTNATTGANGSPTAATGGGGGGGGAGFIRANVMPSQITTSPAVTLVTN